MKRWCDAQSAEAGWVVLCSAAFALLCAFTTVLVLQLQAQAAPDGAQQRRTEVTSALERVVRELSMAYVSVHVPDEPQPPAVTTAFVCNSNDGRSRVDFTSFSHERLTADARESDQNELSYFVGEHPDAPGQRALLRREQHPPDDDPRSGGDVTVLLSDVVSFDVSLLDPVTHEWVDSWDSTSTGVQTNRLPSQAFVRITVVDPAGSGADVTYGTRASLALVHALNFGSPP